MTTLFINLERLRKNTRPGDVIRTYLFHCFIDVPTRANVTQNIKKIENKIVCKPYIKTSPTYSNDLYCHSYPTHCTAGENGVIFIVLDPLCTYLL